MASGHWLHFPLTLVLDSEPKAASDRRAAFPRAHGQERGLMTGWVVMRHQSKRDPAQSPKDEGCPLTEGTPGS